MLISKQIAQELEAALIPGVTLGALTEMPTMLSLGIVHAKALSDQPEDLAAAASGLLKEACARVDGERDGAVATLLGVAEGMRGVKLMRRRQKAAERIPASKDHFRKFKENDLLLAVGEDLVTLDSTFQARLNQDAQIPEATESRLKINWLARHEAYQRIWSPVSALRGDLVILLGYLRQNVAAGVELEQTTDQSPVPWPDIADRGMNLMWRRAQFTSAVERFTEDFGGLWLLSDPNQESRAAEAIHKLNAGGPGGDADDSWLRLRLTEAKNGELDDFMNVVYANEHGTEVLRMFLDWAARCKCSLDENAAPRTTCNVHQWLAACDEYIDLISEDWDKVADYYREKRAVDA